MELTIKDLKQLLSTQQESNDEFFFKKGENVFIRTVTMHLTGKIYQTCKNEIVLEDACWIADSGRLSKFLENGILNECEPFPEGKVVVGRSSIIDCCLWKHPLPRNVI